MTGVVSMKPVLEEFLEWMESSFGNGQRGAASEFAVEPPPRALAVAQVAVDAAVNGGQPVLLGTSVPVRAVIAALLLRRAGITREEVVEGSMDDRQFTALADALRALRTSRLMIEIPEHQPGITI
jgi:uncharacterized protein (DUF433 family)